MPNQPQPSPSPVVTARDHKKKGHDGEAPVQQRIKPYTGPEAAHENGEDKGF